MNTATQINTDDLVKYAHQYITYDISEFSNLHEDAYHCVKTAVDELINMTQRQNAFVFDRHDIEVCERRQIAFVDFSIESKNAMSDTALENQLRSTMSQLHFFTDDEYDTRTAMLISAS